MGLYDTFWGEYKCKSCGGKVGFKEQTDVNSLLENYYLGDYCDRGNKNYFYEFVSKCPHCGADNEISIAIRRGQYVGVYHKEEAQRININDLENIEDGYQRHRNYERMCAEKLGYEIKLSDCEPEQRHVGEYIEVLRNRWKILEVYRKEYIYEKKHKHKRFKALFGFPSFIYRVTDGIDARIIKECENTVRVYRDGFEQTSSSADEDDKYRYRISNSSKLVRIE